MKNSLNEINEEKEKKLLNKFTGNMKRDPFQLPKIDILCLSHLRGFQWHPLAVTKWNETSIIQCFQKSPSDEWKPSFNEIFLGTTPSYNVKYI